MSTYTLCTPVSIGLDIKRNHFIGLTVPMEDQAVATDVVARLHAEHPVATHVCWAFLAGGQSGVSDNSEPSGIADRPILKVLCYHDLDTTLGAIVRYFGGVKPGAGGLIHAHIDTIATVLIRAECVERIANITLTLVTDYADKVRIRHWVDDRGHMLLDAVYDAGVTLTV